MCCGVLLSKFGLQKDSQGGDCMQAVKRLLKNAASRDVTLYEVPGGYHELFMGPEKDDITDHILSWVLEHAKLKANHDEQQ